MDEELAKWAAAWHAGEGDPEVLLARAKKARRLDGVAVGAVWAIAAAMLAWTGRDLWLAERWVTRVPAAFVALFSVSMAVWLTATIRGVARAQQASPAAWIAELRRRQALEVRVGRSTVHLKLLLAFLAVWIPWKTWADRAMYLAEPWRFAVGFGGIVVILAFVELARRRLLRVAERALRELEEVEREVGG